MKKKKIQKQRKIKTQNTTGEKRKNKLKKGWVETGQEKIGQKLDDVIRRVNLGRLVDQRLPTSGLYYAVDHNDGVHGTICASMH